ncbi:MAG: hypothetical protein GY869_28975, partial [Planctomycetes bacterium]|nr:hypothetical protein [Planctomycetota bacterium]
MERLAQIKFQYSSSELSGFTNPQLGIIFDGGDETVLAINPTTGLTDSYVNSSEGTHIFNLKFYEGNTQRGKSKPEQESVNVVLGQNFTMDIIPLVGETVISLTEEGGDATFKFSIPAEIVTEADGLGNLRSLFTVVGPKNPQREIELSVNADGAAYAAETTLSNYQYDTVSYTVAFTDTSKSP